MPRQMKKRSTRPRRYVGRRRGGGGSKLAKSLISNSMIRPEKLRVKLPYVDYYTVVVPAAGQGITRSWNLNSIYDPDRTGVGHQPLGHDEWGLFYTRYRVYGVSYEMNITNGSPTNSIAGSVMSASYPLAATFTDMSIFEAPKTRKFAIGQSTGISTTKLKGYVKVPYVLGQTNEQYRTNEDNTALWNNNPAEIATLNLNLLAMNTAEPAAVTVYVRLIYHVELLDAVALTTSVTKSGQEPKLE